MIRWLSTIDIIHAIGCFVVIILWLVIIFGIAILIFDGKNKHNANRL